jgi:DNA mismatch repair protein MutL
MSRSIRVLPDQVANQIAAGEVVERPASVVKELLENALDARATRVEVDIVRGGRRSIRITDDGSGMGREDLLLSVERHATSKIETAADLLGVRTLGFRGEALPSIAAVSRVAMVSRPAGEEVGSRLKVTGGTIVSVEEAARRRGTTVEVQDLFFNAPARRKFLRASAVETRAVSDVVVALALTNPGVGLCLRSDERVLLDLEPTRDLSQRVRGIWGSALADELIPVEGAGAEGEVRGLVQRPDAVKPGHRRTFLFVNGRSFRDPALLKAVDRAYRTTVPPGYRPWAFLYFDVPGDAVDVNVHPAKAEVRFRNPPGVEALVEGAVHRALAGEPSSASLGTPADGPPSLLVREDPPNKGEGDGDPAESQMALFVSGLDRGPMATEDETLQPTVEGEAVRALTAERPRLWQVLDTYILAEVRDGLLIIDQHSAHERILFEELMDRFDVGGQGGQRLLFPLTIRLSPDEYEQVQAMEGLLARSGFEVEGFGGDTVIVQAVPDPHPYFDGERCFREMIQELTEGSELVRSAKNQHERIAKTFACKGAIKAGQRLSEAEMQELFDRLFATELPFHDVHGRPTIVRLSGRELDRKFNR